MATALESTTAKQHRLGELREFLMSRRARVSPAEAGLPDGGARRRTPGLRREEVAVLAGVGVSWYQWLEQGRDITVSPQVLDSVARVLRLIDAWMPFPAHIMDSYWNTVLYNDAAAIVLGMGPDIAQNCLVTFFTEPLYRDRMAHWEELAPRVVAQFRSACSECPDDEGFRAVIEEAKALSPEFAELWERRDILPGGQNRKEMEHPLVGTLVVEATQLRVPARPDLVIVLHTPLPEAGTAEKLEWLVSPEGRRGAMYPVAG
ncbi:helix-turn-helix transcriptional regulator [Streptomyces zaomyceticus]|uniref:helix-turn-helix transcriptional regulator n=1 Tax=Streptomyces zaomyceticus TaxID=68286 RepID=UPI00324873C9